jgi:hypothetical protein
MSVRNLLYRISVSVSGLALVFLIGTGVKW